MENRIVLAAFIRFRYVFHNEEKIPPCSVQNYLTTSRTQAIASRSRPGNPYDNALAESGWSTLKTELLPRGACFADLEEARLELAEYLDHYDNTQRLHAALGYCTPLEVELHYLFNLP